jgi:uncharacterized membrane protein
LVIWSLLVYEALDFRITPRLLLNSFYITIILTFLTLKVTHISFQELISYLLVGIFSYFSNIALFLPNMDDVGFMPRGNQQSSFLQCDINSLQMFGTVLLLLSNGGYNNFFVWTCAVLTLSFAMAISKQNVENVGNIIETSESYLSLLLSIVMWILLTAVYMCSFKQSVFIILVVMSCSESLFQSILSIFSRLTTFLNLYLFTYILRIIVYSVAVIFLYFDSTLVLNFQPLVVIVVILLLEFYYVSGSKVYERIQRKAHRMVHSKTCPSGQLKKHSEPCPVCLVTMVSAKITQCGHIFHEDCLDLCLQRKPTCPVCRQLLIE